MWIGTENGLNLLDNTKSSFKHFFREERGNGLMDNAIRSLLLDENSVIWIGGFQGLSRYDIHRGSFTHFIHDAKNEKSIGRGHVSCMYKDESGYLWIGTNLGGLSRLNLANNTFDRYWEIENEPNEVAGSHINTMAVGKNHQFWVGSEEGLEFFDKEKGLFVRDRLRAHDVFDIFSIMNIRSLYLDNEGNLWVGTLSNGLYIYNTDNGNVHHISEEDGLSSSTINGILGDNSMNIWISTNNGISKLIKPENGWQVLDNDKIINFNVTDGLQGSQFYQNSVFKTHEGQLYFGGTNGYNSFFPEKVMKTNVQPRVVFTDIKFRNDISMQSNGTDQKKRISLNDTIVINYKRSDFSVEFSALYYFDPEHISYAYKMEPGDLEWNNIGNQQVVNYLKLPTGKYCFKVKASNNTQHWDKEYSQIFIAVLPPYWRTWYAYLFYVLVFTGLLYLFFKISSRWGKIKNELVWQQHQLEREAELNNFRIRFFTDISHELRTPLTLMLAPLERLVDQYVDKARLKNQLIRIQRNGERMLQLLNQLLDLRKLETGHLSLKAAYGDIVKFANEVFLVFRETAQYKNIKYTFNSDENEQNIWFDRDKFEIVLYNLLSNAFKHTPNGGNIELSINVFGAPSVDGRMSDDPFGEGYVEIMVKDDGSGISQEHLDKIFDRFYQSDQKSHNQAYGSGVGLEIVKKFVNLHKGTITVNSTTAQAEQPGKTRFIIKLPKGRKHLIDKEIISDFKTSDDISLYGHSSSEIDSRAIDTNIDDAAVREGNIDETEKAILLVVEDNDEVRKFVVSLFASEYVVLEASNGDDALECVFDEVPDLVLSDIMMPGIDGLELCRRIKSDSRTSHIPVILLTARTAVTFQIEGIETGADDYVTKPFSADFLKVRVKKIIEQRKHLRSQIYKHPSLILENISITSIDEKLMKKTIDYINDHISDPDLGVIKVAEEVGMSRAHFYRKIKALTDLKPVEFIRLIRLNRAELLLKTGKLNVSEVRYAVGIQDAKYFRQSFKDQFGITPSECSIEKDSRSSNDKYHL